MSLRDEHLRALLQVARETRDEEFDCEEFLARVAEYAELRAAERPIPKALAQVEAHERLCANCREESVALIELLRRGLE